MFLNAFKGDYPQKKYINKIFAILGVILLGAIGSGLWNIFLYDIYSFIVNLFLNTFSMLFNGYIDYLHKPIGKGMVIDYYGQLPFILIITVICLFPWISYFLLIRSLNIMSKNIMTNNKRNEVLQTKPELINRIKSIKKKLNYFLIPAGIFISLSYSLWGFEAFYIKGAIQFSERSIEILSPYISSEDVLILRSKYRAVDNADKFYELEEMIKKIAEEKRIKIPEFNSIKK